MASMLNNPVAFFDGGIKTRDGIAAGAAVLYDGTTEVSHRAEFMTPRLSAIHGKFTNNISEYRGLLIALQLGVAAGVREITIYGDSELVVRQVNGVYACRKQHLKPLLAEILRFGEANFDTVMVREAPHAEGATGRSRLRRRNNNERADELCNMAMNSRATFNYVNPEYAANNGLWVTMSEIKEMFDER